MSKPFFITTPIYYINSTPHVGHAYTQIAADARARFERSRGREVYFLTGTDENALKVARAAEAAGREPLEFADDLAEKFKAVWAALNISYDDFVRTTQARHRTVVQQVFARLWDQGHLRLGTYQGWYSVPDETFFREEKVVERAGKHFIAEPTQDQSREPLEWLSEPAHFFRLPDFSSALLQYYAEHPDVMQPESRANETLAYISRGLDETAISRVQEWGIPLPQSVPQSQNRVVYVWFPDALLNYASAPGYLSQNPENRNFFERVWPPDVQMMSKDIFTRFHTTLWPSLLMALKLEMPRLFFAHGFWTVGGRKISKRDPETIVEPVAFARLIAEAAGADEAIGADALRYYCLREASFGSDGDFSRAGCLQRYNSDLANGLGNLASRALSMLAQWFGSRVPEGDGDLGLRKLAEQKHAEVEAAFEALDFQGALEAVWQVVARANKLIEDEKPWARVKEGRAEEVAPLLRELLGAVQWCAVALRPVMPTAGARLLRSLGLDEGLAWQHATSWNLLAPGHTFSVLAPLFPRIPAAAIAPLAQEEAARREEAARQKEEDQARSKDIMRNDNNHNNQKPNNQNPDNPVEAAPQEPVAAPIVEEIQPQNQGEQDKGASQNKAASNVISYQDFAKVELRVGRVLVAEAVPKADKLLRLVVDMGSEQRQILAGLAGHFSPESLVGQSVLVVANLAPRKMRGLESQGMILAASTPDGPPLALATVLGDVPTGAVIK